MELLADQVSIAGLHGPLLLPTTLTAHPRRVTLVTGDPGYGHLALALALAGRVPLAAGAVTLDGDPSVALRRRHVALVDAPDVTSPEDGLSVRAAMAEQLALAGRPSSRAATRALLAAHGVRELEGERFEAVAPEVRAVLLMEVAAARAATRVLVLVAPDRLGGDPDPWWRTAHRLAEEGLTVVVQCAHATARQLDVTAPFELGVAA